MMNQSVSTVNSVLTNFCMRDNKHLDTHVCYDRECVYYPVCLENSSYISINSEPLPDEPESSAEEFTPYGFQTVMEESDYLEDDTQITVKNNVPYPLHCNKTVRPIYTPPEVYTELFKIKVTKEDFLRGLKHAANIVRPTDTTSILQSFYIKTCVRDCYFYLVASTGFHSYMTKINAVYEGVTDLQPDIEYIVPYDEFLNDITYVVTFVVHKVK